MKVFELFEDKGHHPTQLMDMKTLAAHVREECAPYTKEINNDIENCTFWRGAKGHGGKSIIVYDQTREGREPIDTWPAVHHAIDNAMKKLYGHRFRSNVYFGYGTERLTYDFGAPHVVFPRGRIKYCWSPKVLDLTQDFSLGRTGDFDLDEYRIMLNMGGKCADFLEKKMEEALQKNKEEYGKNYDEDRIENMSAEDACIAFMDEFENNPALAEDFLKEKNYMTKHLKEALSGEHRRKEIMMWSEKGYYMFNRDFYEGTLKPFLLGFGDKI